VADLFQPVAPLLVVALVIYALIEIAKRLPGWLAGMADEAADEISRKRKAAPSAMPAASEVPRAAGFGRRTAPVPPPATTGPTSADMHAADPAAQWQAMAVERDNAHKAQIRAHVERAAPPAGPTDQSDTARAQNACLAIKHVFPPRHLERSYSYFGGMPIIPEDFDWPLVHNRNGELEPLHFMAQIDCNTLPDGPARDLLPSDGYLYFFAPMAGNHGDDAWHFVTRYVPGRATSRWEPCDRPFLPPIDGAENAPYVFEWMNWRAKPSYPTRYSRVGIELGWLQLVPDVVAGEPGTDGEYPWEVTERRKQAALRAFHGEPAIDNGLFSSYGKPKDMSWIPYPDFPSNLRAVEVFTGLLKTYLKKDKDVLARQIEKLGPALPDEADGVAAQRASLEARKAAFMDFESRHSSILHRCNIPDSDRAKPVSIEDRAAFMALIDALRTDDPPLPVFERTYLQERLPLVVDGWLSTATYQSVETALRDPDGFAMLPSEAVEAARFEHGWLKKGRGGTSPHQMLGIGDCIQTAADDMAEDYILLLQLGADNPLGWRMGDNGVLQYWIRPSDLAARRFENTVATFECH
jgi:Domain of unknown function (DUF1963)